jgi:hypothetical protein
MSPVNLLPMFPVHTAEVLAVGADDVGVDDRRRFFDVDERLAERAEVLGPCRPDALFGKIVALGVEAQKTR